MITVENHCIKQTKLLDAGGLPLETSLDDNHNDDEISNKTKNNIKKRSKCRMIRSAWFDKESDHEKHYRELIMLFTSWRNEETDLLEYCSYQARYMQLSNAIDQQMKQYAICDEEFNEIQQDINMIEGNFDTIAPCTEDLEQQHKAERNQDLQPNFNESYNISDDLGIPSVDLNTEPLIMNELQDDEYRHIVEMLNREQKEFFYHILHLIKISDEPFYCFLSRGAGVGKSHVTKTLYQAAIKYYNRRAGFDFH